MIKPGEKIPDVPLTRWTDEGFESLRSLDVLGNGKIVLFGVPGAFTRGCSDFHLPGFLIEADEIKARGVDAIVCVGVNDAFVMGAWQKAQQVGDKVLILADGNADLARAMGVDIDRSDAGMGIRNQRYLAIIEDGVVQDIRLEEGPGVTTTSAEALLTFL